jgi:hypothetical protein
MEESSSCIYLGQNITDTHIPCSSFDYNHRHNLYMHMKCYVHASHILWQKNNRFSRRNCLFNNRRSCCHWTWSLNRPTLDYCELELDDKFSVSWDEIYDDMQYNILLFVLDSNLFVREINRNYMYYAKIQWRFQHVAKWHQQKSIGIVRNHNIKRFTSENVNKMLFLCEWCTSRRISIKLSSTSDKLPFFKGHNYQNRHYKLVKWIVLCIE